MKTIPYNLKPDGTWQCSKCGNVHVTPIPGDGNGWVCESCNQLFCANFVKAGFIYLCGQYSQATQLTKVRHVCDKCSSNPKLCAFLECQNDTYKLCIKCHRPVCPDHMAQAEICDDCSSRNR